MTQNTRDDSTFLKNSLEKVTSQAGYNTRGDRYMLSSSMSPDMHVNQEKSIFNSAS